MGSSHILLLAVVLGFVVSIGVAYLFGEVIIPRMAEEKQQIQSTQYYALYHPNFTIPVLDNVNSTSGLVKLPISGYINIVTAQYVRCPDICHWETEIMLAAYELLREKKLDDKVVFVTIGVDPWDEDLGMAKAYMEAKAGKYLKQGMKWVWVLDTVSKQKEIFDTYRISVVKHNDTRLVDHWAGFMLVVDGKVETVITPTSDGWASPYRVAEAIVQEVERLLRTHEGLGGGV